MSSGIKILVYILSVIFPIVGLIVGIIWMTDNDEEKKQAGKTALTISIIVIVLGCICSFITAGAL
ncbi:hypothetical protein [Aquibacillus albus]|uniref:Membrane protein YdbT with pleckstrin-like domain n=1 Tax=Aquibacillus albus TaxID=1168171 RepID=A0ABS2N0B8_9BACI|nr:hypothetical protein [Aquibacillus albus]MBM7571603.1 putative membrane protein YdbT with pleckstrin-like domain [Aquibacillus albus]